MASDDKKFKGVRRRKWGKWVSEIRVPGTQERLWLGSYSSPEAAAVAHDVAYYCLRRPSSMEHLNFPPIILPLTTHLHLRPDMSPASIQKAASDAAMAIDAQYLCNSNNNSNSNDHCGEAGSSSAIDHYNNNNTTTPYWDQVAEGVGDWITSDIDQQEPPLNVSVEDYM